MNVHLVTCLALCIAVAPAQTDAGPPAPHILIETVGPDGWRARYAPTNLGSLLESEQGRDLWSPRVLPLLALWQQIVGDPDTFAVAKKRLLDYGGRVRLAVWLNPGDLGREDVVRAALVLEGDGRTDMAALAADVRQLQQRLPGEWRTSTLGGQPVATVHHGKDTMTAPTVLGGNVVLALVIDEGLAATFQAASTMAANATGKPPAPNSPALRLEFDVATLVALAKAGDDDESIKMMSALGLDSLGRVQLTFATAGPHVQVELAQHFTPAPRGLFAAFFPPVQGLPALQRAVPKGDGSWRVGHFDFRVLFDTVVAAFDSMRNANDAEVRDEMKKELGIDVGDDLVAHMTSEVLAIGSPLASLDRPDDFTWAIAVRLRDAKAFGAGLDTLLEHSKPLLSRGEPTTIDGIECQRYGNMMNYGLWFAVGHDTFFAAGGRDAEQQLTAAIAAVKPTAAPAVASAPTIADAAFADVAKFLPPGTNAQARGDLDSIFALPTEWWFMLLEDLMPFPDGERTADPEAVEQVQALLKKHNLSILRTATGYADSVWRWRLFW